MAPASRIPETRSETAPRVSLAVVFSFVFVNLLAANLSAQERSTNAPPPPEDVDVVEIKAALREAGRELKTVRAETRRETEASLARITEEQQAISALHAEEAALEKKLRELDTGMEKLDEELEKAGRELELVETDLKSVQNEIDSQVLSLAERVKGTLLAAEMPDIPRALQRLGPSADGGSTALSPDETRENIGELLEIYGRVLKAGETVGTLRAPVRVSDTGGSVRESEILRVGLLAGFFRDPESNQSGFVLTDSEKKETFLGEASGLTADQQTQIAALIEDPAAGGFLPLDVTGGAGIATLQHRDSFARWFEVGGVFMYPLVAIALIALLLSIERGITLAIKTLGVRRGVAKVLALVEADKMDEAQALCQKIGGPVGSVLNAALVHHGQDRSVIEDAVQEALLHQAPTFHARLGFIALCAAVAPLLGLLGTVTGMITTFKMVTLFGTSDPRFMAGGISEALITTQAGLFVAIPSLLLRGVLGAVADATVGKLEAGAMSVVRLLLGRQANADDSVEVEDVNHSPSHAGVADAAPSELLQDRPAAIGGDV